VHAGTEVAKGSLMPSRAVLFVIASLLAACNCARSPSAKGGGPSVVVEPLAAAWCQHHYACGRIATSKKWADREACMNEMRTRVGSETRTCAVNDARVSACLSALRSKTCDSFRVTTPRECENVCE
jgi:hypothetical protein